MGSTPKLNAVLRCPDPDCRSALTTVPEGLRCARGHTVARNAGILTFPSPGPGKYDAEYAMKYAAVWGFGYETLHKGYNETLYRSISSLVLECAMRARPSIVVDAGCGVGRTTADCASMLPDSEILAVDASPHMLEWARKIVAEPDPVRCDLRNMGFGELVIRGRNCGNVQFAQGNVLDLPICDGAADLVLSVNIIDRLPQGPEPMFAECARVLKPGCDLVFCDPLNWQQERWWASYSTGESVRALIERSGFEIVTWFDQLPYKEALDPRGSFEEFQTLVVHARRR